MSLSRGVPRGAAGSESCNYSRARAGTQRLPRLAGVAKAVETRTGGKPIKAPVGRGIIDKLIEGDLWRARRRLRRWAGKPAPKTREREEKRAPREENAPIFAAAREVVRKKQRGLSAPLVAIDAIENAISKLPFEKGCEEEARPFNECLYSDQSKALIHVFFAEREVAKIPACPSERPESLRLRVRRKRRE